MLVFFNLIPLLLLQFYPTNWFQKFLGCFPRVNWLPLHAFMDIFQGCYKNGTEGTRDYRYFSGFYLMIRVLHLIPFYYQTISNIRYIFVPLLFSYAFAVLRPYKRHILILYSSSSMLYVFGWYIHLILTSTLLYWCICMRYLAWCIYHSLL